MRFLACALLVIAATRATDAKIIKETGTCVPHKSFPYYCNTCVCGADGLLTNAACTWMNCAAGVWNRDGTRVPEKETCKPGESFPDYCNDCTCRADGLVANARCSRMYCDPKKWNKDGTRKNQDKCVPGQSFRFYCATCTCGDDGLVHDAVCPFALCNLDEWHKNGTRKSREQEETCVPGEAFPKYCNGCLCGPDGLVANSVCTNIRCGVDKWNKDGTRKNVPAAVKPEDTCVPFESFPYYCTTCACGEDGLVENALCPHIKCDEDTWHKNGTRKNLPQAVETCVPGEAFNKYCNGCLCGPDGLVANAVCTNMRCGAGKWNKDGTLKISPPVVNPEVTTTEALETCVPGESFPDYCNACICGESGLRDLAACTRMICDLNKWNADGTRKIAVPPRMGGDSGKSTTEETCVPGRSFKYYCNDCYCLDGVRDHANCTRMSCDRNEWNEDGTRKSPEGDQWIWGPGR